MWPRLVFTLFSLLFSLTTWFNISTGFVKEAVDTVNNRLESDSVNLESLVEDAENMLNSMKNVTMDTEEADNVLK